MPPRAQIFLRSLIVPLVAATSVPSTQENMNGAYVYSTTPGGTPGLLPRNYRDYPRGVESFDVYSPPMATLYSQVWWQALAPVALPEEVVRRFNGSGMAIVGWEMDQVRRTADGDVSVPISALYMHHYVGSIIGSGARYRKVVVDGPDDPMAKRVMQSVSHGMVQWDQPHYIVEPVGGETAAEAHRRPTHQSFQSANGGEYRKSYHGFAPGYALVIDSPTAMQITPMQIDTWNREEMDISGPLPPKFVPGPLPRASLAGPNPLHSGLLECPMTTRLTKAVDSTYDALDHGTCGEPILTFYECFHAAASTFAAAGRTFANQTGSDPTRPPGCTARVGGVASSSTAAASATTASSSASVASVYFNTLSSTSVACGHGEALCICPHAPKPFGQATGALVYARTNQTADKGGGRADYFGARGGKMCAPWPATSLIEQRNPTCDIRHYRGGQWACHHMWSLLDAEQPIPWADQPLVWHTKMRFWVQPYDASYHTPLTLGEAAGTHYPNAALLLGSPWEYDVPKCDATIPGCEQDASGMWVHTISGNAFGHQRFAALNNHCHAPTCISMAVYACKKGTPLANCNPSVGTLVCRTTPVYGGTGHPALKGTRFDEPGYIAIPDCFWGGREYGLMPPPNLDGLPLHIVKTANATLGHYGDMAGAQPWVF